MTLTLLEGAVDALNTYVQANMAAKISALNTAYGDSLLTAPVAYYVGNVPDEMPEFPSIALQGDGWTLETQTKYTLEVKNNINIYVYVADQDISVRFKKLCRYALAIVELLNTGEASYGYTHFITGKVEISDTLAAPSFLQAIMIPVELCKAEEY